MTFFRKRLGRIGEDLACQHLQNNGYQILQRNYSNKIGEIDIISKKGDCLVFVEVKTKTQDEFGSPLEMIDLKKQRKLIKCIQYYFVENELNEDNVDCRIDAISVEVDYNGKLIHLEHIENAVER
ncbi:MAG: putative endonuclease [Candidatus Berkelbacteria bacterium Licking1014_85]|uniref:UPF0102 protein CEN91_290 n=1 Tax=Candidatus Berkelbacteria bacterium Licking1014_85 TaxID=2017148 RepID=A0A554LJY3_9BACT|nr:MAG: putative endonuclease [Candidatus Berkelbacteria bacterium Licking1014_85]